MTLHFHDDGKALFWPWPGDANEALIGHEKATSSSLRIEGNHQFPASTVTEIFYPIRASAKEKQEEKKLFGAQYALNYLWR